MPQRKPHRKSRYGCDQCKIRRVKCDEKPPRCANCITRDERCHFSRLPPPTLGQSTPQTTPSPHDALDHASVDASRSGSEIPNDYTLIRRNSTRVMELELMAQWCLHTYESAGHEWDKLFKEYIPLEACRSDFLMSSMLGLSAFHIASNAMESDPSRARRYVQIGLQYQDQALSGLRIALGNITPDNCSPILFASILISVCVIFSPLLPAGTNDAPQSAAEAILPLPEYINAVDVIKVRVIHWLADTPIKNYLNRNYKEAHIDSPLLVDELRKLNEDKTPSEKQDTFDHAIEALETASHKESSITQWLIHVGPEFLAELRRGGGVALAVYMHWGVLLDQVHNVWWTRFSGTRLVEELSVALGEKGPEWAKITEWCREQVGLPAIFDGSNS